MMAKITRLLEFRYRIASQIYMGIGGAVLLTFAASLVGWLSFNQVGEAQARVNEGSVPELAAAFGVAQYSGALVAASDVLTAATTPEEVIVIGEGITASQGSFNEQLAVLESHHGDDDAELFARVRENSRTLIDNIAAVTDGVLQRFILTRQTTELQEELVDLRVRLDEVIIPAMDDQFFYTVTGRRERGAPPVSSQLHLAEDELIRFRYLAELQAQANIASQLLATSSTLSEARLIEPLRERFESSAGQIDRNLDDLERTDSVLHSNLAPIFQRLIDLGTGPQNGFYLSERNLELESRQNNLLAHNRTVAVTLVGEVDDLVGSARLGAQEATDASSQAIVTGGWLLLAISIVSIIGAIVICWLYVGRVLLRRLALLSGWMRRMAGGDLEAQVDIHGRDEVADMAAALEVFRQHALEIQRLNLVEILAEELQGKNVELEQAFKDLETAQDRIVTQQKLAALGELTAGVAHEIRNPLNFVKNFSESSRELLVEMKETLDENEDGQLDNEQLDLLQDIFGDLSENMDRILTHGDRADRIVQGMLMMGRESVGYQPTNINNLLDEHARLAYHSARALDNNFQLDLQYDLDPDMGEIDANPQDLGRVFLNMVSNACYATDERRKGILEANPNDESYMPTLWITSRRNGDAVEVRIRDNGTGMPPDVAEKIFNPFFTTKPTDKGTGLGLAISADIVRQHGGDIQVATEPDDFTEMHITLPIAPPEIPGSDSDADADDHDDDDEGDAD